MAVNCNHTREGTLERMEQWFGRYRCTSCGVFFHFNGGGYQGQLGELKRYICSAKGCSAGAICKEARGKMNRKAWFCASHRKQE